MSLTKGSKETAIIYFTFDAVMPSPYRENKNVFLHSFLFLIYVILASKGEHWQSLMII